MESQTTPDWNIVEWKDRGVWILEKKSVCCKAIMRDDRICPSCGKVDRNGIEHTLHAKKFIHAKIPKERENEFSFGWPVAYNTAYGYWLIRDV